MSRAFVKETAQSAPPPERMVSDGLNLVTKEGSAQIGGHVERLEAALKDTSASGPDVLARETLERDLRTWSVRKASAQIVPRREDDVVAFGSAVTIRRGAREQTFRIVGADGSRQQPRTIPHKAASTSKALWPTLSSARVPARSSKPTHRSARSRL